MNLEFFKTEERDGYLLQYAYADKKFFSLYKRNRTALAEIGVSLSTLLDDTGLTRWVVTRLTKKGDIELPKPVKTTPYRLRDSSKLLPYQIEPCSQLVASLLVNRYAIDASDTGTGKTFQGLGAVREIGLIPAIICTKPAIMQWKKACSYMGVKTPIFICNYESATGRIYRKNGKITKVLQGKLPYTVLGYDSYTGAARYKWTIDPKTHIILFDEQHRANGSETNSANLLLDAHRQGYMILGMSATACDKIQKFKTLGTLTGALGDKHFIDFLEAQGCFINESDEWEAIDEKNAMRRISQYIFPAFGARVRKDEVPGFPKCQNVAQAFTIDKAALQNKEFEKCKNHIMELVKKVHKAQEHIESAKSKMRVLRTRYRQMAEIYKIPLLIDLAKDYISSGHSVIIFVCYNETLKILAEKCKTNSLIYGSQSESERRTVIANFGADKTRLVIANMQAGGTAIDGLQDLRGEYSRVALIAPIDDSVILKQSMGRIHRSNSKSTSLNLLVYAADTIEEKVCENVKNKLNNIDLLNDGDLAEDDVFN